MSRLNVSLLCTDCAAKLRKSPDEVMAEMECRKCGAATRYEFCVACESDILETMLNETVSNTECAKCGVSFNAEIDTEGNLCPACYWHAKHYKMPYIDYPAYVESLKEMGFDVPKPNRVYEFDSHNFQGFQDGKPYNVTLIDTGFGNPLYCISNTFREHAPMGFERHASGVINCYVKRSLLALPEWSTCQHTHWYRVRFADNGKDNGYRNHVRAHSPNDARRMVLRDGEWNGHDNREIVSVECFTDYPEPEFETNTYRGLDVGAYGDY